MGIYIIMYVALHLLIVSIIMIGFIITRVRFNKVKKQKQEDFNLIFRTNKIYFRSKINLATTIIGEGLNFSLLYLGGFFDSIM